MPPIGTLEHGSNRLLAEINLGNCQAASDIAAKVNLKCRWCHIVAQRKGEARRPEGVNREAEPRALPGVASTALFGSLMVKRAAKSTRGSFPERSVGQLWPHGGLCAPQQPGNEGDSQK